MKVMKFGGGCLSKPEDFLRIVDIIKSEKDKTAVVVSAVSGITNILVDAVQLVMQSEDKVADIIRILEEKHITIIRKTIKNERIVYEVEAELDKKLKKLERLLYGIAYTEEVTSSLKAIIYSYGERLCALILAGVLRSESIDAIPLDADEIGMLTDDSFEHATAILPEVKKEFKKSLLPLLKKGTIPVVTGYFGCTSEGKVTTFGRNGSDYSAAVIAYGIGAEILEIWKDVDGFMSGDPKMVKKAHKIDRLSYKEAAELSYFGAKILHPRTVEPLIEAGTLIKIKNMKKDGDEGTIVSPSGYEKEDVIKSVTYNKNISVLKVQGPGVGYKPGVIAEIGQTLAGKGINIYSIITSQTCINLLIDKHDAHQSYDTVKKIVDGVIDRVDLEDGIALVAVVGEGLFKRIGVAARVFTAVASEYINVEMISSGASEVAYYFIVQENDVEAAINAVHKEFFGNGW